MPFAAAVVADGLRDRQDVGLGERAVSGVPRWPLVPKLTSWFGSPMSGFGS